MCALFRRMPKERVVAERDEESAKKYYAVTFAFDPYWVYLHLVRGPGERLAHGIFVLDPRKRALLDRILFELWYDADLFRGFGKRFGNVRDLRERIERCPAEGEVYCREFLEGFMRSVKDDPRGFMRRAEALTPRGPSVSIWAVSGGLPGLGKRA